MSRSQLSTAQSPPAAVVNQETGIAAQ